MAAKAKISEYAEKLKSYRESLAAKYTHAKLSLHRNVLTHKYGRLSLYLVVSVVIFYLCMSSLRVRHVTTYTPRGDASPQYCECPPLDGSTELEQLRRYWAVTAQLSPQEEHDSSLEDLANIAFQLEMYDNIKNQSAEHLIPEYEWEVAEPTKAFNKDGFEVMKVTITEKHKGVLTRGGSTFKIIMWGSFSRNSCPYRDFFNGTYLICCILRENVNTFDVYLMNVNFLSYQVYYSLHHLVKTFDVNSNRPLVGTNGGIHDPSDFQKFHNSIMAQNTNRMWNKLHEQCASDDGYWLKYIGRESWRYVRDGQYTHHMYTKEVDECFHKQYHDTVYFVGDSHMRNTFLYILHEIRRFKDTGQMYNENTDDFIMTAANQTFLESNYEENLYRHLMYIYGNYTAYPDRFPDKSLLIVNSGCWDLAFDTIVDYILDFENIISVLDLLQYTGKFQIVWMDIPPWPHILEHNFDRHLNSYLIGAVNAWTAERLHYLGIYSVPMWYYGLPFEDGWVDACTIHFLCPVDTLESAGDQGKEMVQDALRHVCRSEYI